MGGMEKQPAPPVDSRMSTVLVAAPLLIGLGAVLTARSWTSVLPDPVATHWGFSGGPDGYTPLGEAVWLTGLGGLLGLVLGGTLLALAARVPEMRRGAGALVVGMSLLVTALQIGSLWLQRGLADATAAPGIGRVLAASFGIGALGAIAGAAAVGSAPHGITRASAPVPRSAPRAALGEGSPDTWTGIARSTPWVYAVLALVAVPLAVIAFSGGYAAAILVAVGMAVLLMASTSSFRVRVDRAGLTVRSVLGWPGWTVPLGDIAVAEAVEVDPMREFGGVGLRAGRDHRFGVVLRKGPALQVRRGNGSAFLVTVDEPAPAAALLNALADEDRRA